MTHDKCQSPDCSFHTGGMCFRELRSEDVATIRELRALRVVYRQFEFDGLDIISKQGWRMVIEPVTDRIKTLSGGSEL